MRKILLLLVLVSSISLAEDSYAEHEAKMQQIQERSTNGQKDGSGEQKKTRERKGNSNAGSSGAQDGNGNQYKGSRSGGGGGKQR